MTTGAAAAIVYPETDGMPLPDGEYQAPIFRRVVGDLDDYFERVPGAWVNGDTFIYYVEGNPRISVSPDCYVVFGLSDESVASIERNNTYRLWEVGKFPDFILEIGSESTADADSGRKRELYAELGAGEYWRFDASGGEFYGEPLIGERLVNGEYRRIELRYEGDGQVWGHSEALNLDLWWKDNDLRFWDPLASQWLLRRDEERAEKRAEAARADEADAKAEAADAARRKAEDELAEMRRRLAELKGNALP